MEAPTIQRRMRTFFLIWIGQLVSLVGTQLTGFALGVWIYQRTGSVTQFALVTLSTNLPGVVLAPLAGVLVDRWDRRRVMIVSDFCAGLITLALVLFVLNNRLDLLVVCLAMVGRSICNTFQWPAYVAVIPLLVSKEQLGRANGMAQGAQGAGQLAAPILGGILILNIGIQGVILIDVLTFLFSVTTLLISPFSAAAAAGESSDSLWNEFMYGWSYIATRSGLLALLLLFAFLNLLVGIIQVLATPLLLSLTSVSTMGVILSIGGSGMLVGSVVMGVWGGPKRRIHGVIGFTLLVGLSTIVAGALPSTALIAVGAFGIFFSLPLINGCSMVIWQRKVDPAVQGRVFATIHMISLCTAPIGNLIAGPLADRVFEPLMSAQGRLAGTAGQVIGVGPGRGIGLLFIIIGLLTLAGTIAGYSHPRLRNLEDELPDSADRALTIVGGTPTMSSAGYD
jgi:DHA3 family macrolide efflux protein-like MFS transporter